MPNIPRMANLACPDRYMTIEPHLQEKKKVAIYFAAAAAIAIAGMLHLMLAPGNLRFNVGEGVLFLVGGIAQIFWIIPLIRRWGRVWYSIGIAGNLAFFSIWLLTRFPGNPITGRGEMRINTIEMITEVAQFVFIGLAAAILLIESRKENKVDDKRIAPGGHSLSERKKSKKGLMIVAGIVVALILTSLFLLPSLMPRRGPGNVPREFGREGGGGARQGLSSQLGEGAQPGQQPQANLPSP